MSCDCNSGGGDAYNNFCNADIPYPSVSHESVPSMMDNLTLALYGLIQKDVSSGKVKWIIPCDPNNSATVFGITRNANEGLMCYFIRAFQDTQAVTFIPAGEYGQILSSAGTNYLAWVTPAAGNVPGALVQRDSGGNFSASVVSANLNGSLQGGFPGSLVYQSDSTHTEYLSVGSLNQVLLSNGTLPTWATLAGSAYVDTTNASNITSGTLPAGRLPAFSGEITSSIGSAVLALTPTGVSAGAYNVIQSGVARVPQVTVDSKGRLSNVTMVALAASAVTDTTNATNISSGTLAAERLPASGAAAAVYGASTPQFLTITVDVYGRITEISKQSDYVPYTLPTATSSVLGGIKVGSNLTISNGVLSADATPLPIATASVLGGIKVGSNLTINPSTGVLSADATSLPIATASILGGIKVGANLAINPASGVLSANATPLLPATTSTLGGVIVGSGLAVSGSGVISIPTGPGTTVSTFTGTGSQLTFGTLNGFISTDPQGYIVSVGGIDQRPTTDYTIQAAGATGNIVFATAPPTGATILVRAIKGALGQNATSLQGSSISTAAPTGDQFLGWDAGTTAWTPREITTGDVTGLSAALDGKASTARTITAGTGLTGGGDLTADRTLAISYGSTSGTAAEGNDSRLSDSRTPTTHAGTHQAGGSDQITSLALTTGTISTAPGAATDIVNKSYVDSIASGINFHDACDYGTVAALSPAATYNQPGGAGVGVLATLTGNTNTALQVDGITVAEGKRVLVKNQSSAFQNGIYNVTRQGDGTTLPYILTRASDYDTSGSGINEVQAGDFIIVLGGTIANTAWVQQTPAPINFGVTNLSFIQFAAANPGVTSFSTSLSGLAPATTATGAVVLSGTLGTANGGTGAVTAQAAINALSGGVVSGQYLRGNGTNVVMSGIQASDVPTLNQDTTGTAANVTGTVAVNKGGTGQTSYTDGQLLIGNTSGNTLTKASLTAGSNVTITPGAGSITIAATGGITWRSIQTSDFTATSNSGYPVNTTSSIINVTLPASPAVGDVVSITDYASQFGTNACWIYGLINGSTTPQALVEANNAISFVYTDAIRGWLPVSRNGAAPISGVITIDYLVVGGGGGGGNANSTGTGGGGGGGAVGVATGIQITKRGPAGTPFYVTVGAGGASATSGGPTSFLVTVGGGGGGGSSLTSTTGIAGLPGDVTFGGSGGGGPAGGTLGSTTRQGGVSYGLGFAGGTGGTSGAPAGGGGGAGAAGSSGSLGVSTSGGNGIASSITGTSTYYGGGGAGATAGAVTGTGGLGGGGNIGAAGTLATGGGGGGALPSASGGAGGSGVVIISYTSASQLFVGGTVTKVNGKVIHKFSSPTGTLLNFI